MKPKNKILVVVEIAIVLCSIFLVALPTIAAEQTTQEVSASEVTTASEDDYILDIYGNANEDDTIDMRDLTYVKLMFFGKKPETELGDAKYDGKINPLDFIQIKLIIVGKEKELTFLDFFGETVTVNKPVERIVIGFTDKAEVLRILNAECKIVGIDTLTQRQSIYLPGISKLPVIGSPFKPDYEAILSLHPDVYMPYVYVGGEKKKEWEEKLPGITIICLRSAPTIAKPMSEYVIELGYLVDRKAEAEDFIDWYQGHLNTIKDRTEALSEDEKSRVLYLGSPGEAIYSISTRNTYEIDLAGGKDLGAGMSTPSTKVDPEWVIEQNPDIILRHAPSPYGYETKDLSKWAARQEEILNRPELANVNAVKRMKVYVIDQPNLKPIPLLLIAYLAKVFHPELFKDQSPQTIHQEYIDKFCGIDFHVKEDGIFVYPPLEG